MPAVFKKFYKFTQKAPLTRRLTKEITAGMAVILIALLIFSIFSGYVYNTFITSLDLLVIDYVNSIHDASTRTIMRFITNLGGEFLIFITIIVAILFIILRKDKEAKLFLIMVIYGTILNQFLKFWYQRPRPNDTIDPSLSFSFPSGHSMVSLILYVGLAYFVYRYTRNKILGSGLLIIAALFVLAIGISRIYLGVHYTSDVIAGFAAGIIWLTLVLVIEKIIILIHLYNTHTSTLKHQP